MRAARFLLAAAALAPAAPSAAGADAAPVVLCDFETGEPADGWTIRGLGVAETETPHGRGLSLSADRDAAARPVGWVSRASPVRDWRPFRAFTMRARSSAKTPVEMRLQAVRGDGPGRLLRRFTVEPGDWRDVVLELGDFRDDGGDQAGSFADVGRIVLRWDDGSGEVAIDDLALVPGDRGAQSCRLAPEDVRRLAFGDAKARRTESAHFLLLDDADGLADEDAQRLLARLEEGLRVLAERYGVSGELDEKVPFLLFATRERYAEFVPRLGEHFGATVGAPKADGFSVFGMGMGWFDPKQGWDRPVFVHEALHGAVHRLLGVASNGNWIQEGLAAAVQSRLHPASLDRSKLAASFAKRGGWLVPWEKAFAEPRAPLGRYPQLLSVMDFLAEEHREGLAKAWDAVRALKKPLNETAPAAIAAALGTDAATLEERWFAWGAGYYAEK